MQFRNVGALLRAVGNRWRPARMQFHSERMQFGRRDTPRRAVRYWPGPVRKPSGAVRKRRRIVRNGLRLVFAARHPLEFPASAVSSRSLLQIFIARNSLP